MHQAKEVDGDSRYGTHTWKWSDTFSMGIECPMVGNGPAILTRVWKGKLGGVPFVRAFGNAGDRHDGGGWANGKGCVTARQCLPIEGRGLGIGKWKWGIGFQITDVRFQTSDPMHGMSPLIPSHAVPWAWRLDAVI